MKPLAQRRSDLSSLASIIIFFVAFFPQVLFARRFIIAGDAFYYSYPLRTVAWHMIRAGQLPLWTPYVLSGYPLLSMAQVALGYPLTWGYLFLPGHWAEQLYVLAPFLLSPIFTYFYLREIERSRLASLLGGLAFGYGGMMASFISNSGMLTNGLMWAPLLLVYIERARTRSFWYCLPRAALIYSLSVLAGHGQSYVYVGALAVAYGLFLSLTEIANSRRWLRLENWRPIAVATGATLLAAAVAAFQLFETLRAARRSTRSALSYEVFGEGSFSVREALLSIGAPLYHYIDTSAYLTPLALLLAVIALVATARSGVWTTTRVWFWLLVGLTAFVLLLGTNTPVYRIVFYLPVMNQFRVPSRHTFEWTLAVSVLAAYGWDVLTVFFSESRKQISQDRVADILIAGMLTVAVLLVGVLWWRAASKPPVPNPSIYTGLSEHSYWFWKAGFTTLILSLGWWSFRLQNNRSRSLFLAATIMLACFVETSATVSCWWGRQLSLPEARISAIAPTTRYLQEFSAAENRVYTRAGLFSEEFTSNPRLDAPNLSAIFGLHNLAGMEPLILDRYSRALGGVGPDSVTPRAGQPPNDDLFNARSHVLDILNTRHVVSFANLKPYEEALTYKDSIGTSVTDINAVLKGGETVTLPGSARPSDSVVLVSSLANSVLEPQGANVARLRLRTDDGQIIELFLRAGVDTSEWAYDRPDVRAAIKHERATVFDSRPADSFSANRYWTRLSLGARIKIQSIEIENVSPAATLALDRASLFDSQTGVSSALLPVKHSEYWTTVYDQDQVQILRNSRVLPRFWLVADAEAVDSEEALRSIRGESTRDFDPTRTVLLEVNQQELPTLTNSLLAAGSQAKLVSYEPSTLKIQTEAVTPTVLVVSEMFYPGWEATVDGKPERILLADYLLRAVSLTAGKHVVEMHYRAPAARNGAILSVVTIIALLVMLVRPGVKLK